jgi:hypothetical protein
MTNTKSDYFESRFIFTENTYKRNSIRVFAILFTVLVNYSLALSPIYYPFLCVFFRLLTMSICPSTLISPTLHRAPPLLICCHRAHRVCISRTHSWPTRPISSPQWTRSGARNSRRKPRRSRDRPPRYINININTYSACVFVLILC